MPLIPVIFLIFMALAHPSYAYTEAGITQFKEAMLKYRSCEFALATEKFVEAREALPVLGDYALLYQAKSHSELKAYARAEETLKELQRSYPDSPIRQESMSLLIQTLKNSGDDSRLLGAIEKHLQSYPSDRDMRFLEASLLKKLGKGERATEIFKDIYIGAGHLAKDAGEQIDISGLKAQDLIARASNLIDQMDYDEAEATLRRAVKSVPSSIKDAASEKLALCLFRQKKYTEAAPLYLGIGQNYHAARAYLRAGNIGEFERTLDKMTSAREPKAAELLISKSEEKRRGGHTDEAIELLDKVPAMSAALREDAAWRKGWVLYTSGRFKEAADVFSSLYDSYKSARYLYWKARAAERAGLPADQIYAKIEDDGLYGLFTIIRKKGPSTGLPVTQVPPPERAPLERIDALVEVGLTEEAARELLIKVGQARDNRELTGIAFRLKELGRYREAIAIASKLPEQSKPGEILYPLAYWQTIEREATRYGIDPFLVLSLIREESRFDPDAYSPAGAIGLMQLMPQTARHTASSIKLAGISDKYSILNAENNIRLGVHYLSILLKEFPSAAYALAAYNAGSDKVKLWMERAKNLKDTDEFIEDIPFLETRLYVKNILTSYYRYRMYPQFNRAFKPL